MTHDEVKNNEVDAKYLHGVLSEKEREEFEVHMFDCPECSGIVKADMILKARGEAGQAQDLVDEDEEEENGGHMAGSVLLDWAAVHPRISAVALLAGAFAVLLAGYQNAVVIPELLHRNAQLSKSRPLASFLLERTTRSQGQVVNLPPACLEVELWLQLNAEEDYPAFVSEFIGDSKSSFEVAQQAPDDYVLRWLVSCSDLPPDKYTLNLYGLRHGERAFIEGIRFEASRD